MGTCCSKSAQRSKPDIDTIPRIMNRGKEGRPNLSSTTLISNYKNIDQKIKDTVFGYIHRHQSLLKNKYNTNDPYFDIKPEIYIIILQYYHLEPVDELNRVEIKDLSVFILKKVNNKTIDRLWRHLSDKNGLITANDIHSTLQFTAVLFIAYRYRVKFVQILC